MEIKFEAPDASAEFADKLASFVAAGKHAFENGWQAGEDVPVLLASALTDLIPAIGKLSAVSEDLKVDAFGAALAIQVALKKVL